MTEKTDELRDIFLTVSDDGTVIEHQEEGPSKDPVDATDDTPEERSRAGLEDGLEDALAGAETSDAATG